MRDSKDKKRTYLLIAIVVLSVVLIVLLAILLWKGHGPDKAPAPAAVQQTEPEEKPDAVEGTDRTDTDAQWEFSTGIIETPYVTLYFNQAFTDHLAVIHDQGPPYRLEFYTVLEGKEAQRLFDIFLGKDTDGNLGTLEINGEKITASMTIYTFTPDQRWKQDEINTVLAMQDEANALIKQLMEYQVQDDYAGPIISENVPKPSITNYAYIDTPYCALPYPAVWWDYLKVEKTETDNYSVLFYGQLENKDPVLLFTVVFGGDQGELAGTVKDSQGRHVSVNILLEDLDLSEWSEKDRDILYEMQEAVNQMIAKLPLQ